jgi:hypothetical protein
MGYLIAMLLMIAGIWHGHEPNLDLEDALDPDTGGCPMIRV